MFLRDILQYFAAQFMLTEVNSICNEQLGFKFEGGAYGKFQEAVVIFVTAPLLPSAMLDKIDTAALVI